MALAPRRRDGLAAGVTTPRHLWTLFEHVHAVTYFSLESAQAAEEAGYLGFWAGYVAQRAAPLGPVGPDVVTASFFGFSPSRVERVLPHAWEHAAPERALAARLAGVDRTLDRIWGAAVTGSREVAETADLLWEAAQACDTAGRVLAAANRVLPRPPQPHLALWQATTTLREHRGDGHTAALVAEGLGPVEAMLLPVAAGEADGEGLRRGRAWPDEAWDEARARLAERGWLSGTGLTDLGLTDEGRSARAAIEARTDRAARAPWDALGPERTARAAALLRPLVDRVVAADLVPELNPIGLPRPTSAPGPGPTGG